MGNAIFSEDHYRRRQAKLDRRSQPPAKRPASPSTMASPPQARPQPTDAERQSLRAAQRDPDLVGFHHREYELQDGTTYHSEPHVLPPRHDVRKSRVLTTDPDLRDADPDLDPEGGLPRIGALSATDASIRSVDTLVAEADHTLRNLETSARSLLQKLEGDLPGSEEATHAAEQIAWILGDALRPWLDEVSRNLDVVINATPEGRIDRGTPASPVGDTGGLA